MAKVKMVKTYIVKLMPDSNYPLKGQPKSEIEFQNYLNKNKNVFYWEKHICMQSEVKNVSSVG